MIKKQMEIVILTADLERVLAANEGAALSQFENERPQLLQQSAFQLTF